MVVGQFWWNAGWLYPASVVVLLTLSSRAVATGESALEQQSETLETSEVLEQINRYSHPDGENDAFTQVTSVSQLRDVQPEDWAYEAVRRLVERYGVIQGYPDGTFRGNRPLSRYEFAAVLQSVFELFESIPLAGGVTQQDLATIRRLREEFILELSLLRGDVDAITARTKELELTQFSTTTQLNGEVIFGFADIVAGEDAGGDDIDDVDIFGHRTRLNLETSFTGRDRLLTRLQAEGLGALENRTQTPEGELAFTGATDSDVQIDALLYSLPIGSRTEVLIAANAGAADDFASTVNPFLDGDGASGALSRFATRSPLYRLVEGSGIGIRHAFSDSFEVSLGYLAGDASNAAPGEGLFDGSYGAIAQVVFQPTDQLTLGLTYINSYRTFLQTGSNSANLLGLTNISNSYGIEASYQINPRLVLGGWVGYTAARVIGEGDADIWNWAVTLALPDLGKEGNLAGILVGMEPKVTASDSRLENLGIDDPSTSFHIEAFYQYQLTDNIAIAPGVIWLTAPNHDSDNGDVVIGTVRTTFWF